MNWLDYILLITVGLSAVSGLRRGFARTVVGVITAVAAIVVSLWFYSSAAAPLNGYLNGAAANIAGFIAVFLLVTLAGGLIGWLLARLFKWAGLGWLDRLLGASTGVVRGALFATGFILLLCAFTTSPPRAVVESRLSPYALEVSSAVSFLAPKQFRNSFDASAAKLRKIWRDTLKVIPGAA